MTQVEHVTATATFPIPRTCPFGVPETYDRLRRTEPVSRVRMSDGRLAWLLTRHADIQAVLVDPRFSANRSDPGFPAMSRGGKNAFTHFAPFMISLDGKEHTAARKPMITEFSMRRVAAFRPRIQEIVDDALDRILELPRPVDLVRELALTVPSRVITELLGATPAHLERFYELAGGMLKRSTTAAERDDIARDMRLNMDRLIAEKEANPGDDLLSREIARQRAEHGDIDRPALASLAQLLLLAGNESTSEMIALGVVALLTRPDQLAALTAEPGRTPGAVDELLRYFSVVEIGMARVATEDVEVGGVLVKAGEGVVASNVAGNRDPEVFPGPDDLDVLRDARGHLAQGFGPHQCLGQNLARAELEIVFDTLFRRLPDLRLAVGLDELPFKYDALVFGLRRLPVTW
ncbi:cytochrome P450 [Streptomyces sp. NBC_01352]|uniref:Cytochrome P450 n=1 Tax=Streptomyces plumbiresistens TaxID=511811 RepID=A0ABP7R3I6_9ACTN|nr:MULTISPECIES: cytochrome P450 [unclassified Streptomyces]MCX4701191.1 cytochrome P450 [Streptomyces sp. NBC_01373]